MQGGHNKTTSGQSKAISPAHTDGSVEFARCHNEHRRLLYPNHHPHCTSSASCLVTLGILPSDILSWRNKQSSQCNTICNWHDIVILTRYRNSICPSVTLACMAKNTSSNLFNLIVLLLKFSYTKDLGKILTVKLNVCTTRYRWDTNILNFQPPSCKGHTTAS